MSICKECTLKDLKLKSCERSEDVFVCMDFIPKDINAQTISQAVNAPAAPESDAVNAPSHYTGTIECIDYMRDKLTQEEFTGFCMGNVLKYCSRWRKKDGLQDLKKAKVYLEWAIEWEEKNGNLHRD